MGETEPTQRKRRDDPELLDEIAEASLMVITGTLPRETAEAFVRARSQATPRDEG
jgi:hypothetical protein